MNPDISHLGPALFRHARANLLAIFLTLGESYQTPAAETNSASNIGLNPLAEGLKAPSRFRTAQAACSWQIRPA
jgi:hypothetical protein